MSKNDIQSRTKPYLIGIAGGSGSGKTSIANIIFKYLGVSECLLFSMDTYYKDLTEEQQKNISEYNFDHPDALDFELLNSHINSLMNWESINMPTYDFNTSSRGKETKKLYPNKIIIFEGILAFHDKRIRDLMDIKIFVDLDGDIRLSRRIYRDIIDRGREMKTVIDRYHKFVKPAFEIFIKPTRKFADIIIPKGAENTNAIDMIAQQLKNKSKILFPNGIKKFIKKDELIEKNNNKNYIKYSLIDGINQPENTDYMILESLTFIKKNKNIKNIFVIKLTDKELNIGRHTDNDIIDNDMTISRYHAIFKYNKNNGHITITNKSKFGVLLLIKDNVKLNIDQKIFIQMGKTYLSAEVKDSSNNKYNYENEDNGYTIFDENYISKNNKDDVTRDKSEMQTDNNSINIGNTINADF